MIQKPRLRHCVNVPVELTEEAVAAVQARLGFDCSFGCECGEAMLVFRRLSNGARTVTLQCNECGASVGGPLKLDHHPFWDTYPVWDERLRESYSDRLRDSINAAQEERAAAWEASQTERRAEYSRWLQTSEEWWDIRNKVMLRANWRCEACLNADAREVHHVTYAFGRLPPAWELRAVCRPCHAKFSDPMHEWAGRK